MIIKDHQTDSSSAEVDMEYDGSKSLVYYIADKIGIHVDLVSKAKDQQVSC